MTFRRNNCLPSSAPRSAKRSTSSSSSVTAVGFAGAAGADSTGAAVTTACRTLALMPLDSSKGLP